MIILAHWERILKGMILLECYHNQSYMNNWRYELFWMVCFLLKTHYEKFAVYFLAVEETQKINFSQSCITTSVTRATFFFNNVDYAKCCLVICIVLLNFSLEVIKRYHVLTCYVEIIIHYRKALFLYKGREIRVHNNHHSFVCIR